MVHWLTTNPHPNSPATGFDAGQRGWRLHSVIAPEDATVQDVAKYKATCGMRPAHGWGLDLFIERRCDKCVQMLGVSTDLETYARKERARWRKNKK